MLLYTASKSKAVVTVVTVTAVVIGSVTATGRLRLHGLKGFGFGLCFGCCSGRNPTLASLQLERNEYES